LERVADIANSDETDLIQLAVIAGCNPKDFYVGADLRGVDIRGQDLTKLDLTGADFSGVVYDEYTKVDPVYVPLEWNLNTFKHAELTAYVYDYLGKMVESGEAKHLTHALRILVRTALTILRSYNDYLSASVYLHQDKKLVGVLKSPRRTRKNMTIKVYSEEHKAVIRIGRFFMGVSAGYNACAIIAIEVRSGIDPQAIASHRGASPQMDLLLRADGVQRV
jgi:hypothetical protein